MYVCMYVSSDHSSSAVSAEAVVAALATEQSKEGASLILSKHTSSPLGELHLGGFTSSGTKYVQMHHIARVVNAAAGLESFFVAWAKQLPVLESLGAFPFLFHLHNT